MTSRGFAEGAALEVSQLKAFTCFPGRVHVSGMEDSGIPVGLLGHFSSSCVSGGRFLDTWRHQRDNTAATDIIIHSKKENNY